MNDEVKELIDTLKEYADGFTGVLAPTEESVKALLDYINQLETNRDEAIEYIENIWYSKNTTNINDIGYTTNKFLKIKQLLERGKE